MSTFSLPSVMGLFRAPPPLLNTVDTGQKKIQRIVTDPSGQLIAILTTGSSIITIWNRHTGEKVKDLETSNYSETVVQNEQNIANARKAARERSERFCPNSPAPPCEDERYQKERSVADLLRGLKGLCPEYINDVAFRPSVSSSIACAKPSSIDLYNTDTAKRIMTLVTDRGTNEASSLAFNSDGKFLVAKYNTDCDIKIWNLDTQQVVHCLNEPSDKWSTPVACSLITPDIFAVGSLKAISIYDIPNGDLKIQLNSSAVPSVLSISPDNKSIASASSRSGEIEIWDIEAKTSKTSQMMTSRDISDLTWTPDSHYVITSCSKKIQIWDSKKCCVKKQVWSRGNDVFANSRHLSVNPNGGDFISGMTDGSMQFWDLTEQKLIPSTPTILAVASAAAGVFSIFYLKKKGHQQ